MGRTTAVQSVVDTLRTEIADKHQPGDLLGNERMLAARFGVGRNTAREALVILQVSGLIRITRRGPVVTEPDFGSVFSIFSRHFASDPRSCIELLDLRAILEAGILPELVARVCASDLTELDAILDRMEAARTVREGAEADYAFHARLVTIAGNGIIARLYAVMKEPIIFYMEIGKNVPRHDAVSMGNHRRIVAALGRKDVDALMTATRRHYDYSCAVLDESLAQDGASKPQPAIGSGGQTQ